ncbi:MULTISPECIES: NAD-dependent deacetylase [unclassified Acinetobacter]|uniref:SIR2 family NAD-dependent protein deacylase n=1 Tax=unclassified Acinetobacter TaxID=196816 RepID=UPI0035B8675D
MQKSTIDNNTALKIKRLLQDADGLLICAGAGMGVDSGLPDFRGNQGMWQAYPALGKKQLDFTQIANPAAFELEPHLAWGFYGHRLDLYRKIDPHQGFELILNMAQQLDLDYFVFTSNVDGQFQKARFDADKIYECHGSIHHLQCLNNCKNEIWSAKDLEPNIDTERCHWQGDLPTCQRCGALARPNILMFGDWNWLNTRQKQQQHAMQAWLKHKNPVVIEIGAGTAIPTVRHFSEQFSPNVIRINLRDSHFSHSKSGISLASTAEQGMQWITQIINS